MVRMGERACLRFPYSGGASVCSGSVRFAARGLRVGDGALLASVFDVLSSEVVTQTLHALTARSLVVEVAGALPEQVQRFLILIIRKANG